MSFNPKSLPSKVYEAYKWGVGSWPLVVERAIEAKITNVNRVADIMFYLHHPELKGRSLRSDETELIGEWKGFREMIRRRVEAAAEAAAGDGKYVINKLAGRTKASTANVEGITIPHEGFEIQ